MTFTTDLVRQLHSLVIPFSPVQAAGTPSPDNPLPISGWTGVNVYNETAYNASATPKLNISWQSSTGTIYGGTVTLNEDGSADVVAEMAKRRIDAFTSVIAYEGYGLKFILGSNDIIQAPIGGATPIYSDIYVTYPNKPISYIFPGNGICYRQANKQFMISDSRYDNVTNFLSAVGNKEIVFTLATPQTYHIPNVGSLTTYLGTNNIWSDTNGINTAQYWIQNT